MRLRLVLAVLVVAVVATSCGGSVGSNDWTMVGKTPDERHLLITTLFGGVASGCTRWEGWEVDESEKRVDVRAQVWRKRFPSACTDEGITETIEVDLDEPLGSRDLVGCGSDDCRSLEPRSRAGSWDIDAVTSVDGVMVANAGAPWSFGSDGTVLWHHDHGTVELLQASFDAVVAYDGRSTTAYDPLRGAEVWHADGFIAAAGEETVYLCRGDDANVLAAIDSESGGELWQANLPCGYLAVHDDVLTIVAVDRAVDGGNELLLVDSSTGDVILREKFDDGVDDRVNGFEGLTLAGERVVVAGQQADLVVLGSDAVELIRRPEGVGMPIGVVGGLVIVVGHDHASAIEPTTGETVWESREVDRETLVVSEDTLWSLDPPEGSVSRLDSETGDPIWTTPVGLTSGFDVAADSSTAYVATSLAIIAVDSSTGEVRWWQHLPFHRP